MISINMEKWKQALIGLNEVLPTMEDELEKHRSTIENKHKTLREQIKTALSGLSGEFESMEKDVGDQIYAVEEKLLRRGPLKQSRGARTESVEDVLPDEWQPVYQKIFDPAQPMNHNPDRKSVELQRRRLDRMLEEIYDWTGSGFSWSLLGEPPKELLDIDSKNARRMIRVGMLSRVGILLSQVKSEDGDASVSKEVGVGAGELEKAISNGHAEFSNKFSYRHDGIKQEHVDLGDESKRALEDAGQLKKVWHELRNENRALLYARSSTRNLFSRIPMLITFPLSRWRLASRERGLKKKRKTNIQECVEMRRRLNSLRNAVDETAFYRLREEMLEASRRIFPLKMPESLKKHLPMDSKLLGIGEKEFERIRSKVVQDLTNSEKPGRSRSEKTRDDESRKADD